jgi:hypothetical protein
MKVRNKGCGEVDGRYARVENVRIKVWVRLGDGFGKVLDCGEVCDVKDYGLGIISVVLLEKSFEFMSTSTDDNHLCACGYELGSKGLSNAGRWTKHEGLLFWGGHVCRERDRVSIILQLQYNHQPSSRITVQ